ncbi:MAG TPA: alpha/beta hydrolase [Prolixibacteraceae bacterium]|nr:alpha/beta hydrolase [Prolixibacteraceae bacterium]
MNSVNCYSFPALVVLLLLNWGIGPEAFSQNYFPGEGTYDGKIGNDQVILVVDDSDPERMKGYYVLNRGKAVEESHSFSLGRTGKRLIFQSDLYLGKMKGAELAAEDFSGTLSLINKKRKFLFFRQKADVSFVRRPETAVAPTERYQKEIFSNVEVKSDLLYGKAKGYWTHVPYSDDPYITTLSKGMIKAFNDPQLLDLKLDIYYPKSDLFKNRPLVMLIHGGAFYIGSKESACERELATSLAKRGYVVASIDYRLGFKLLPADIELSAYRAIQDAHAALRFLSHNAKGLGIDPHQVYVGGTSAGAMASLNVAFMDDDERPERIMQAYREGRLGKIEESGNKYTEKFTIKAVANLWGGLSDLNIIDQEEKISVLSIHGTADDIVPYETDYPFRNAGMINRLVVDKMYGSKLINDRLKILGNRNRLVSLDGLGHEPELDNYKTLNQWMDTIKGYSTQFFYQETAPEVKLPANQLNISSTDDLKPIYFEVSNGSLVQISVTGGVKAKADPKDASVIWLKNTEKNRQLVFLTTNKFEAWDEKKFSIKIQ